MPDRLFLGLGTTALAVLLPKTHLALKSPHPEPDARARLEVEARVYQRFADSNYHYPSSVLRYFGRFEDGIVLEYAEKGDLRRYLRYAEGPIEKRTIIRWARQAAQALVFAHANGVLHGDINCSNFFLDKHLNLKVADFAGSSIDQSQATICYSATHQLPTITSTSPTSSGAAVSVHTEIFAFGSSLYEMVTGSEPYDMKSEVEVEDLFRSNRFPDLSNVMALAEVIGGCWNLKFKSMKDALESIEQEALHMHRQGTLATMLAFALFVRVLHGILS